MWQYWKNCKSRSCETYNLRSNKKIINYKYQQIWTGRCYNTFVTYYELWQSFGNRLWAALKLLVPYLITEYCISSLNILRRFLFETFLLDVHNYEKIRDIFVKKLCNKVEILFFFLLKTQEFITWINVFVRTC